MSRKGGAERARQAGMQQGRGLPAVARGPLETCELLYYVLNYGFAVSASFSHICMLFSFKIDLCFFLYKILQF